MKIKLISIDSISNNDLLSFQKEFKQNKEVIHGSNGLTTSNNIANWRKRIIRLETKPTKNEVRTKQFFIVTELNELVGVIDVKHQLTPYTEKEGGNISYAIRKQSRGQGFAQKALAEVLTYCQDNTYLSSVLLTCKQNNDVSRRVILVNGGMLVKKLYLNKQVIEHYRINLKRD